jgi:hypothetical protein
MGSMNDFFVRKVTDDGITAVRAKFSSAEIKTNSEYIRVLNATLQEPDLIELSLCLETDVMWLSYHSITDGLEYYHWQAGKLVRALGYGLYQDRTWERIEGQAEAWERQFFFDPQGLASLLDDAEDNAEDRLSDEEKRRLEQFWQAGELVIGENVPILGAQRCAFHIATYYRFPGWDFERLREE